MDMVRLAGLGLTSLGLAVVVACGAAWGQAGVQPRPAYEEALAAVSNGGCERTDAERYIRFHCEESESLWYFTIEGRPEHTSYYVAPAYPWRRDPFAIVPKHLGGDPIIGGWGTSRSSDRSSGARPNQEEIRERMKAHQTWMRDIITVWRADSMEFRPRMKRDRGKLYPLEPR